MSDLLIKNAKIVNEGSSFTGSVLVDNGKIKGVYKDVTKIKASEIIDASGLYLLPGVIDDQVHFREPGLTHKGEIFTESRAAAAGGITSFMEMPNTIPQTITQEALNNKFVLAETKSCVNFSFYMGATNDNLDELLKTDPKRVCGIKIFMGASTGNMLVDNPESLRNIFANAQLPVAVHCEDESVIRKNSAIFRSKYGEKVPVIFHPKIRSEEACYKSSSLAVDLASRYNTRLHVLHLSTKKELELFQPGGDLNKKRITSEVCIHHLWFNENDYEKLGTKIKWNPAIKTRADQDALLQGLISDTIDVIATDHAPHTSEEKAKPYFQAPSGGPLVQHSLIAMLEFYKKGILTLEKIVEKMSHAPAQIFKISGRGYIREGYWADLVLVDLNKPARVEPKNLLYKCGWSPFENTVFSSCIITTIVNGRKVYDQGRFIEGLTGMALSFDR